MPNDLPKMFVKIIAVARVVIMQIIARYAALKGLYHLNLYDTPNAPKPSRKVSFSYGQMYQKYFNEINFREIFVWTFFRECQNQIFLRGFIFADGR